MEMKAALEKHDSISSEAIERAGGTLVKSTGDGVMAVFDDAASGLESAVSMQKSLAAAEWSEIGGIKIRIGIHQGEAQQRDGDYFGPVVNRAARLMSAGHGGQILVSAAVASAVGVDLRDLGKHRLKDLAEPEHIFQVVAAGMPDTFPPLSTLDATPNNLPTQTSTFLGRVDALDGIKQLMDRPETRLITLVGPGGTGKTRLALQAAAEHVDRFRSGVFFVDLSTETGPDESFANVTRAVGIDAATDESALEALERGLAERSTLLVLDNLEQIEGVGLGVDTLLGRCPDLKVIATSRQPLRVRSEHLYPVEPLSLPVVGRGAADFDAVAASEATQLFIERAAQQVPSFALDADNAADVASICIRLDGLPLAIELAAARLRMFSLRELDQMLQGELTVLRSGAHDLPERQRTLAGTIEWSVGLLTDAEEQLLLLMSVFAEASFEDVEAVAVAVAASSDTLEDLASLVDKSLVRKEESADGSSRFSLLETIRSYSSQRLAHHPDRLEAWRRAHAIHYGSFASRMADAFSGETHHETRQRLAAKVENLQIAWAYWSEQHDLDRLHELFDPLWMLYDAEGWYQGAILLAESLLDALADQPHSAERTREQIALETSLARARMLIRGYTAEGEAAFLQALKHAEESGTSPQMFPVLRSLASFYTLRGEMGKAAEVGEELLEIAQETGDLAMTIDANLVVGINTAFTSGIGGGRDHLEYAVEIFDPSKLPTERFRLGPHGGVVSMTSSAFLMVVEGLLDQGLARAREALEKAEELGHAYSKAYAIFHVAYIKLITGDVPSVAGHASELLALANQHDYQIWRALAMVLQGLVEALTSDPVNGQTLIDEGIELYQQLPTPPVFWTALLQLRAPVAAMTGDMERAFALIEEAVAVERTRSSGLLTEMLVTWGDLLAMTQNLEKATSVYTEGLEIATSVGAHFSELRILTRLSHIDGDEWRDRLASVYDGLAEGTEMPDMVAARMALGR